jgi:hypothetical protein
MKCWDMAFAISRVMLNVVVVVVVMMRSGSLGSAERFDCENLRHDKHSQASSLVAVRASRDRHKRLDPCKQRGETYVVNEFGKVRKYCLCVPSSIDVISVANRSSVSWVARSAKINKNKIKISAMSYL